MTNAELLAKLRAEIDKLYGEYKDKFHQCGDQYHLGLIDGLDMAERVLNTLESEKPMNQDGLEEEFNHYCFDFKDPDTGEDIPKNQISFSVEDALNVARHFAKWGAEHLK